MKNNMKDNNVSEEDRRVIAFVQGAKWWQFYQFGSTAFASEVDEMEQEAERLLKLGRLGQTITEREEEIEIPPRYPKLYIGRIKWKRIFMP